MSAPTRLFQTPFLDDKGNINWPWRKYLEQQDLKTVNLDLNGVVTAPGVDMSRSYTAKSLANVPNGPAGGRAAWDTATQKTSAVDANGNLLLKNIASASGTTVGPSTNSVTYVVVAEMTLTFTTAGNKVLLLFSGCGGMSAGSGAYALFKDGVQLSADFFVFATFATPCVLSFLDAPTAAAHTYDIRYKSNNIANTFSWNGTARLMQATELG